MARQVQSGFAQVSGGRLYCEVAGEGQALVLLHVGLGDSRTWKGQFLDFAQHYRVVRYDLRGFGQSDVPHGPWSNSTDLWALLAFLGIERVRLVGVSAGGSTAIDFTLEHPGMVEALVLVGSAISGTKPSPDLRARVAEIDHALEQGDIARAVELELQLWVDGQSRTASDVDPAVRELIRDGETKNFQRYSEEWDQWVRPLEPPAIERLSELAVPTLVVVGDRDVPDVLEKADLLVARIARARKVVMPGVAHVPQMERPAEFNRIVLEFLRQS